MIENKVEFVKKFEALLKETTSFEDLHRLDYIKEDIEILVITYKDGSQKKLNINNDTCFGIIADFSNKVDRCKYIALEDRITEFLPKRNTPTFDKLITNGLGAVASTIANYNI